MDRRPHPLIANTGGRTRPGPHPRAVIGRRDLLKLTAGAGVVAFGVAGRGLVLPWVNTGRAAEGAALVEPEVRASRDGLLDTTIEARVMPVRVAGGTAIMSVYDGTIPGPTLRVRPGDRLRIKLVNRLNELPAGLVWTQGRIRPRPATPKAATPAPAVSFKRSRRPIAARG